MRRAFFLALAAMLTFFMLSPVKAQQQPKADGKSVELKISNALNMTVMVELYCDGKLVRTREIVAPFISATVVSVPKLKPGNYELHFLASGYKPFIKRVLLAEDDTEQMISVELNTAGGVVGGGPSLQELAEQIEKLKKENAEIRAEIEKLKGKK
jgi:cell division protein YceG involved in septum cleavage